MGAVLKWPKRMSLDDRAEYQHLVQDGHQFVECGRYFEAVRWEDSIRNTKLYRTLLHELGHLIDYRQNVLNSQTALDADPIVAAELYFSKPISEREAFAHTFSESLSRSLRAAGEIPFNSKKPV